MKRTLTTWLLMICIVFCSCACAEGLLPSLTDTIGKPMPSLGEALKRYPDVDTTNADGSVTEVFRGVTETDFNTFSVYLSEKGLRLRITRQRARHFQHRSTSRGGCSPSPMIPSLLKRT